MGRQRSRNSFIDDTTAISSVMATVILAAITIAIVIPASLWTGGLVSIFTRYEKIEIKNTYVINSGGNYVVNIEYVNTGSSPTSIDSILLNGVPYSSYMPHATLDKDFSTPPSICETGVSKLGKIIIPPGAADPSGNRLTDSVTLVVTLHTTGGKNYPTSVTLLGGGYISSTVQRDSSSAGSTLINSTTPSENSSIPTTSPNLNGSITDPQHELGVFGVDWSWESVPDEAMWVWAMRPDYQRPRDNISVILNWYSLHPPWDGPDSVNYIETAADLSYLETQLKSVNTNDYWGILFIEEEHYRIHVNFNDDVNATWFGERMLGYPLYLKGTPSATRDQWLDEMFLRMVRGFYNYFHPLTHVGICVARGDLDPAWDAIQYWYGDPAFAFLRAHYDFILAYAYTSNLADWPNTSIYYGKLDQYFPNQKKFWILTRIWEGDPISAGWEPEAMALEIKNSLDRQIVLMIYLDNNPPFNEVWQLIKRGVQLYDTNAPYYEEYIEGENLLTGYIGKTYGWVKI